MQLRVLVPSWRDQLFGLPVPHSRGANNYLMDDSFVFAQIRLYNPRRAALSNALSRTPAMSDTDE